MPNTPPTLTGFNPSITLLENDINAAALLIYGDVDFVDPDDNFNGGTPTLTGLLAEDRAAIRNQGIAAGRIGVSGSDVTYGGVVIDTFAGGVGGTITVTFNASATSAAIDALTKNLTYANVSNTPTASRTLVLNVTDAEGADLGPSGSAMTISVTAPNEAPINTVGGGAAGTEDTPIALTGVSVSDVDSDPALDNITVHLSVARGTLVIRTDVVNGITASHITGGGQGTNGITLTATQNQINATLAAADGLTYQGDLNFNGADSLTVSTYNGVRTDPINFASKVDYSASANPIHLVTADVNGDGILDLVYAGYFGQVGIRLGNGDGTFQAETLLSGANNPVSVAVADLNNDGIVDIAVANYGGGVSANGRLGVHYGTGGGAFGSMTIIAPIPLAVAFDVVAADLNHDGRSDLIVAQRGASIVKVFIQQANGTLVSTVSDQYNAGISNYINSILVGDFNNDGNPDLVTFNPGNSGNGAFPAQISLLLGNANGTFQPLTSQNTIYTSFSLRAWEGVAGDFDGDGNLDLAWVSLLNTGTVQVMFGNGTGLKDTFDIRLIDSSAIVLSGIKAGDVNGDGRPDLIAISQGNPGSAFVLINNGDRTFQPRTALLADFNPESIAIGDFDGDGDMDFAVDNQSSNSISVFLNQILSRGDIDTKAITVSAANDAPSGANATKAVNEDGTYTFAASDFGFTDPDGHALASVTIATLPAAGILRLSGVAVTAGQEIAAASLGQLTFAPAANANGTGYASFTFQVRDTSGSDDLDLTPNTITFNVNAVNDAPAGADNSKTINEDSPYTFAAADFGFTDPVEGHLLAGVRITTLPTAGILRLSGVAVTAGQTIAAASIGNLTFTPAANASGSPHGSFTFQVQDNGGTASGGVDLDPSANSFTFNVTAVNDPPSGGDATRTFLEDSTYTFAASDFGFTDPDGHALASVIITTLPAAGTLRLNGIEVTQGQEIAAASIGQLTFAPAANANGTGYAAFTFQVRDTSGSNDLDASANTITFNVTAVNDAPSGADATGTIDEDSTFTFAAADFGFSDPDGNSLLAVKITTLPGAGTLRLNGVAVTAGQSIAVADIGNLTFTPAANANGAGYADFTFQVQDNGGTANSGLDTDQSPNAFTFNVTPVNETPTGADATRTILEDSTHIFAAADFGFTDTDGHALASVMITTLPAAGTLRLNGVAVTAGQEIAAASLGQLTFEPAANANGAGYAAFTFQVRDTSGSNDLDPSPNTITFNVTAVNDAPSGADATRTIDEDSTYTFAAADFGFSDPDGNSLLAVKITTLPGAGTLRLNGIAVTAGQSIAVADIPTLTFAPAANANGAGYAAITFQVQDNGGTADGGVDLDQSPNTISFDVTAVNDAPSGADATRTIDEDSTFTFAAADFGFSDPDGNSLLAVKITTLPGAGTLRLNGVAVTAGQSIAAADIGNLTFTPAANANGASYAGFTFQVQDNGGTANSGLDTDQSPNAFTFNVTPVNDAPTGADATRAILEDSTYTFAAADFGFTDTDGHALASVIITTLPAAGTLRLNGVAVTAGQEIAAASLGQLTFEPAANANGAGYAAFTFQVRDNSGSNDLDASPNTFSFDVTAVNDAPSGADLSTTRSEDGVAVLTAFSSIGFSDPDGHSFAGVVLTTLPTEGGLYLNDVLITAPGTFISAADIDNLLLRFRPDTNESGSPYTSFTYQVRDNGGTANGGQDTDQSPNSFTFHITPVNDAPSGADATRTMGEDTTYTFAAVDFGFSDPVEGHGLLAVKITTLPTAGTLRLSGAAVTAGQSIAAADIGNLTFTPAANANGAGYAGFTFQVQDNGGTGGGGVDLDQSPNSFTFNVDAVNDAPTVSLATGFTVNEQVTTSIKNLFSVGDVDSGSGQLSVDIWFDYGIVDSDPTGSGVIVSGIGSSGVRITGTVAQISEFLANPAYTLTFTYQDQEFAFPKIADNPPATLAVHMSVSDNGFTGAGGEQIVTADGSIAIIAVNDAPAGTAAARTIAEDSTYTFAAADFGFTDVDGNSLLAVKITTLPGAGTLRLNGTAVTAGQVIAVADIPSLTFTPAANANGTGYASFSFQVQDNGGTANNGVDLDQSANSFTFNVTAVADPPLNSVPGAQNGTEDANLVFSAANGNAISIGDPESSSFTVTLGVTHGTLTLGSVVGLGSVTGNGGASVIVTGTAAAINAAFNGLIYRGNLDYNGPDTLSVLTSDGALSDSDTVAITLAPDSHIDGTPGNDTLNGTGGNDTINGRAGNDTITGGAGNDTMSGGLGNDVYNVDSMSDVVVELAGEGVDEVRTNQGSKAPPDRLVYVIPDFVENLTGTSAGAQGVRDNALDNVIVMGAGHDLVVADAGGVDNINGGGGNDFIYFGDKWTGADIVNGGAGVDTISMIGNYASGNSIVFTATNLVGIERMAMYSGLYLGATPFSYNVTTHDATVAAGTEFFVTAASLQTNETLTFNGSAETNGRFTIHGGAGADLIAGGSGNDFFLGRGGNDQLFGGGGADFLIGGLGADQLTGGAGNDVFRFQATNESVVGSMDSILDFQTGDKIDLGAIDANSNVGGNQSFAFIGSQAFHNVAGELRVFQNAGTWFVETDVNGDGAADMIIGVTSAAPLTAGDFIL